MFKKRSNAWLWMVLSLGFLVGFFPATSLATPSLLPRTASPSQVTSFATNFLPAKRVLWGGGLRIFSSVTKRGRTRGAPIARQVVDGGTAILSLPALIVDFVPLLGNIIALSSGQGRFGWSLAGIGFSLVGALLMIPTFSAPGVALALGIIQVALLGISLTNLILALRERSAQKDQRQRLTAATSRHHRQHRHLSMRFGF